METFSTVKTTAVEYNENVAREKEAILNIILNGAGKFGGKSIPREFTFLNIIPTSSSSSFLTAAETSGKENIQDAEMSELEWLRSIKARLIEIHSLADEKVAEDAKFDTNTLELIEKHKQLLKNRIAMYNDAVKQLTKYSHCGKHRENLSYVQDSLDQLSKYVQDHENTGKIECTAQFKMLRQCNQVLIKLSTFLTTKPI